MTSDLAEGANVAHRTAEAKARYEALRSARDGLIRALYRAGHYQPEIAKAMGLSTVMVGKVCRGVERGKVAPPG